MQKVLFIYQNAFSQTGGIQTFNKYFIAALEEIKKGNNEFNAELLSIYDNPQDIKSNLKYKTLNKSKLAAFTFILKNYNNFDTFIFAHVNLAPLAIFLNFLNKNCKIIFITHGIEIWKKLPIYTEKIMNKSTILTVSSFSKNELLKYNNNLRQVIVFPNCIKLQDISHITENPYNGDEFNILSVTRLTKGEEFKGIDSMVKTIPLLIKKIPNLKYSVIGKGEDIVRLKQISKDLKVEQHVNFLGFVDDISAYYQHCDIFSLPSKKEGFGIVYMEAMQHKKPVIAANAGGATDVVIDGKTGFLCEYDDTNCLENKIAILFNDKELQNDLGRKGEDYLKENFTFFKFKNRLISVLEERITS